MIRPAFLLVETAGAGHTTRACMRSAPVCLVRFPRGPAHHASLTQRTIGEYGAFKHVANRYFENLPY